MSALAGGSVLCAALVAATLRRLRAPLLDLLTELCAGRPRARFWWRVLTVEVVTGTALCTSLTTLGAARTQGWRTVAAMAQGALAGLLLSLATVALAVLAFQRELERGRRAAQPPEVSSSR